MKYSEHSNNIIEIFCGNMNRINYQIRVLIEIYPAIDNDGT